MAVTRSSTLRTIAVWEPHVFFQDDVHLTSKLTLNLGVRYDLFTPYTEINNILSNFDTGLGRIVIANQGGIDGHGNIRTDYSNFAPRFGFAYHPACQGPSSAAASA